MHWVGRPRWASYESAANRKPALRRTNIMWTCSRQNQKSKCTEEIAKVKTEFWVERLFIIWEKEVGGVRLGILLSASVLSTSAHLILSWLGGTVRGFNGNWKSCPDKVQLSTSESGQ